ncbi:MAG TPA: hypothetical protein PLY84_03105 [Bacilli bacterium]|nr:hypothetical protein [Bacilli bacterium]
MKNLIVIISKDFLPIIDLEQFNYIIVRNNYELIDHDCLLLNNEKLYFDYLIIDNLEAAKKLDLLIEEPYVVTNAFFETSTERIFAFGDIVLNLKPKDEQLRMILEYIKNPY